MDGHGDLLSSSMITFGTFGSDISHPFVSWYLPFLPSKRFVYGASRGWRWSCMLQLEVPLIVGEKYNKHVYSPHPYRLPALVAEIEQNHEARITV